MQIFKYVLLTIFHSASTDKASDKDSLMSVIMLVMTRTITKRAHHTKSYEFFTKPIEETL